MNKQVLLKSLIETRVQQQVTFTNIPGLYIEAFCWGDYTLSFHSSRYGETFSALLFKDAEEIGYVEMAGSPDDRIDYLFNNIIVPNVPEYFDHLEANDCADNGYIGGGVWAVRVVEEPPFQQFDVVVGSHFFSDTMEELDNQDLGDFMGLDEFDHKIDYDAQEAAWNDVDMEIAFEQVGLFA